MSAIATLHNALCGAELNCENHDVFIEFLENAVSELDKFIDNKGIINKVTNLYHKIFHRKQCKEYKSLLKNIEEYKEYYKNLQLDTDNPFIPYGDTDPRWIYAALVALQTFFTPRSKYYISAKPKGIYHHNLWAKKIAIVGDFGSCDKYQTMVLQGMAQEKPDIVIHLGDIYVSGTPDECDAFWKTYCDNINVPLWSLIGNHEYICKGKGFFKNLIKPGFLGGGAQKTSFFSLESDEYKIQLLALDTGYKSSNFKFPLASEVMDYDTCLDDEQEAWATERLLFAKENNYRTIILSHHQYFSTFWEKQQFNTKLGNQLFSVKQPITAWLFGHDHRSIVHCDEYGLVKKGLCIGHGSMPITTGCYDNPSENFMIDDTFIPNTVSQYGTQVYNNGFVILNNDLNMDFYQVDRNDGRCWKYNNLQL
jgi:hypothetical protein